MKDSKTTNEVTYWIGTFEGRPHICQGENMDYKFVSLFSLSEGESHVER